MLPFLEKTIDDSFESHAVETFLEFLKKGFKLNEEDRFQEYDLEITPWHELIAEWIDDKKVEWINLIQGTQTGKTTVEMGFALWVSKNESTRLFWVQANENEVKLFVKERLKPYIEGYDSEAIDKQKWKMEAFTVFKARWKMGYATTTASLRSFPAKYIVGDECGIWKQPISVVKKRTRTFEGKGRKGIFATSPPQSGEHHSWKEAKNADFYRWFVPCPTCKYFQSLIFKNLIFGSAKEKDGSWNYEKIRKDIKYSCCNCGDMWSDDQKFDLINSGKGVCVDPDKGFEPCPDKNRRSKSIQVSALYSILTPWSTLAIDFIEANATDKQTLNNFITDELAEVLENQEIEQQIEIQVLEEFVDPGRDFGIVPEYNLITGASDVQRLGDLYWIIIGWKAGAFISGHILDYGIVRWLNNKGKPDWKEPMETFSPYLNYLHRFPLDSSDGSVTQHIYNFCNWAGDPFVALKDGGNKPPQKFKYTYHTPKEELKKNIPKSQRLLLLNSCMVKNDIITGFNGIPGEEGSWSFPKETDRNFLKGLTMEYRTIDKNGKFVWKKKYANAANHYFSSLVYATGAMEDMRHRLQSRRNQPSLNQSRTSSSSSGSQNNINIDIMGGLDKSLGEFGV